MILLLFMSLLFMYYIMVDFYVISGSVSGLHEADPLKKKYKNITLLFIKIYKWAINCRLFSFPLLIGSKIDSDSCKLRRHH